MSPLEAEVQHLRQRNQELQAQLDRIATARESGATSHEEEESPSPPEGGIELTEQDRTAAPACRRRSTSVSDSESPGDGVEGGSPPPAGPREEASFDNECNNVHQRHASKRNGTAAYAALSIENGDGEAGGPVPNVSPPMSPLDQMEDGEESEDLMHDDSSHNKHRDKGTSSPFPCSALPLSATLSFPPFGEQLRERGGWLVGLLVLQSGSAFILARNEAFLESHMVIVQFLTMLVGAGGNAGNQAAVGVIRALATGTLNGYTRREFLLREARMAVSLSVLIGVTGFVRARVFRTPWGETVAVTTSVALIVLISVVLGCTLPLGMRRVGIDPAHSSTSIQVIMDIMGVLITVGVSSFVLSFKVFQGEDADGE